jgi:hypothetical protein
MADCGMGMAVDIRVIHKHVLRFLSAPTGGGVMTKAFWGLLVCRAAAEGVLGTSDNFVGEFGLGGDSGVIRAQRIC